MAVLETEHKILFLIKSKIFVVLCTAVFTCFSTFSLPAQTTSLPEYQLKAIFLYNFAQFVEWPSAAYENSQSPFIIGVLGDDPFGDYLDETVNGEKVNNHPMVVKRYQHIGDVKGCHILFVGFPTKENFKEVSSGLKNKSILTVSDTKSFIEDGGIIKFLNDNNKIKIAINLEAAKAEDLVISAKLLKLAQIITP
jgi:hypothetical protein